MNIFSKYFSGQVSSPEEVTSDIDKMTLQDKKAPQAATTGKAKRMRVSDDREAGLLFRSLTNSIFQILAENQSKEDLSVANTLQQNAEFSPMEQLFMKPFDPTLGKMSVEQTSGGEHMQFQFATQTTTQTSTGKNKTVINITGSPGTSTVTSYTPMSSEKISAQPLVKETMTTRKGSDSDNSLSSSKSSNHSLTTMTQQEPDLNSPYTMPGSSGYESMSSPGDFNNSPGYQPPSNESAFSENQVSPIECLLMTPACAIKMPGPQNLILQGKLKAFEEQQIVPNGEYIGNGLDDIENLPSVYIADDCKLNDDLMTGGINENGFTDEEDCDFFSDVEAELNEEGISLDDLDLQLLEFNRFQCPHVRAGCNMKQQEKEAIISDLSKLAITLQSKFEIMTCHEIKTRHSAYLVSMISFLSINIQMVLL